MRDKSGVWSPVEAKKLINYTKSIGGKIAAAELFNEPNMSLIGGAPIGYKVSMFIKDLKEFAKFIRENLPDMLFVGPGTVGEGGLKLPEGMGDIKTEEMLSDPSRPEFDVFSYHYYGAMSQRFTGTDSDVKSTVDMALKAVLLNLVGVNLKKLATSPEEALSEDWLNRTVEAFNFYKRLHDKYEPDSPIWITETADALCGGNPWSATFLDCFRYLEQLGRLAKHGVQVIMHNTLAASEYSLLDQNTHLPKPNYWAALLWAKLMGQDVYDAGEGATGIDLFAHNTKGRPGSITVLIINTNETDALINLSSPGEQYTLTSKELEGKIVELNGKKLELGSNDSMPDIKGNKIKAGSFKLPPRSITFLTLQNVTEM